MSDQQTHSSTKTDNTPEATHGGAGGAGFDEELVLQRANIQRAMSNVGDIPPDPKTVLQMQSTLGNRSTIQLVNQKIPKPKLQRKKADVTPFGGLRMVQRKGGDIVNEEDLKKLQDIKDGNIDEKNVQEVNFKDNEVDPIIGDPNAKGQDDQKGQNVQEVNFKDNEVDPIIGDPNAKGQDDQKGQNVQEVNFKDNEVDPIIGDPNAKGLDDQKDENVQEVNFKDDEVEPIVGDPNAKGLDNQPAPDPEPDGNAPVTDAKPEANAPAPAPQGKSGGERTGAVFKNMFNTTLGLGVFSIMGAVKAFKDEVDVDQKQMLYGDAWEAYVKLERAVAIGQAVADVTASLGFITGILGAVATVMTAGIAAPLTTIGTVLGILSMMAHVFTGTLRVFLGIKMASQLDKYPIGSAERAFVKGNMINTFVSAGANAVGAIFSAGGVLGWFNGIGNAITGSIAKEGSSTGAKVGGGILGGFAQGVGGQLAGGTSGDIAGQVSEEINEDEVDKYQPTPVNRMPLQRAADGAVLQRKGDSPADAISAIDAKLEQIRKMKAEFKQAPSVLDESASKEQAKTTEFKQQQQGVEQAVPAMEKLQKASGDIDGESKKIEGKSDEVLKNIHQEKAPEPPKKQGLFSRIVSAVKSAFNKLLSIFNIIKKKIMAGIAAIKAKITQVLMKVMGVEEPMETAKKDLADKQKEIPKAVEQQEKNQAGIKDAKGMVSDSVEKLEKTEKAGIKAKERLIEQQKQEEI